MSRDTIIHVPCNGCGGGGLVAVDREEMEAEARFIAAREGLPEPFFVQRGFWHLGFPPIHLHVEQVYIGEDIDGFLSEEDIEDIPIHTLPSVGICIKRADA